MSHAPLQYQTPAVAANWAESRETHPAVVVSAKMININIYRCDGEWAYAMYVNDEYDHSDTVDTVDDEAGYDEVVAEILKLFPGATTLRVADIEFALPRMNCDPMP